MNRFYLIDKPLDYSSFDIIRVLRKKLNIKKMGHTGTLDPLATGGLLIATGNYTKLIPYFEKDRKTYEFTVSLDGITASYDLGEDVYYLNEQLQKKAKKDITIDRLKQILEEHFKGIIIQIPPKYSALKINGKKACDLMRQGIDVKIKSREVEIFNIEVLDFKYPLLTLKAEVSAGTYIRSIASDLGEILSTGGYITKLRRTKIGALSIDLGQGLDDFDLGKILDIKDLFKNKDFINVDKDILEKIDNGLKINGKFDYNIGKDLFIFDNDVVTNIVEFDGEKLIPKRKI